MSWEYSENILVQNSAGKVLKDKLSWEVVFAYNTEVLGDSGTLGRKSYKEIVLTRYLRRSLFENNDWMTDEYADSAVKRPAYVTSHIEKASDPLLLTYLFISSSVLPY